MGRPRRGSGADARAEGVLRTVWRAVRLLDPRSRRSYVLAMPIALAVMFLELLGFVALAAIVQVLATPDLVTTAGPTSLVGITQSVVQAESVGGYIAVVGPVAITLLIARGVVASLVSWWQASMLASAEAALSTRLLRVFLNADYGFHLERHSADLIRTVALSVRSLVGRVLLPGTAIITETALIAGLVGALLFLQPLPALTSIAALTVGMMAYLLVVRRKAQRIGIDDERLSALDQRILQEGLGAVKVLTILERRDHVIDRFAKARREHARTLRGMFFMANLSRYYLESVILLVAAAVAFAALLANQTDVLGSIGVMLAGSMRLLPSVQRMLTAINTARVGASSVDTIEADLAVAQRPVPAAPTSQDHAAVSFRDSIELRDVTFSYPSGHEPALRSVSLRIRYGESVGLVGTSGSGKTTLVDILTGLLRPSHGGVYVDGTQITEANLAAWRHQIGYVPQETVILDDTVRRNVALGLDDAAIDDAAVRRALTQARLLELVDEWPEGLDTRLGERGVRMSGGQRQRIGIARALYHNPRVLVLDEATAALDTTTEQQILATIESLRGEVTIIMIAHRLSTVQNCDTQVRIEHGQVVAVDTRVEAPVEVPVRRVAPAIG